ncbi:MAG TPA: hypothetical protein VH063_05975 [Gaiellaceae bacterium]|jgi:DNA topoisomerase IB|nr:hypothetical protein [Gaiellaceae bacterium]
MSRLRHVDCGGPGLTRRRFGRGFGYLDEHGNPIRDEEVVERITALAIPPAWRDVWICPYANGHLQAVGTDDAGRRQYLYHPRWREHRDREKFETMLAFGRGLPAVRGRVAKHLRRQGLSRERVLACAVGLLDQGLFRVGGEEYADENGSYGLATLERRHVTLDHGAIVFDYEGKTGRRQVHRVSDPALYRVARELTRSRRRDPRFLAYRNGSGLVDVRSDEINAYVKELAGDEFSAKDFRTWHATVLAAVTLALAGEPPGATARKRALKDAICTVSDSLGNTPAVCRASYVDPRVIDRFAAGRTIADTLGRLAWRPDRPLSVARRNELEASVLELLDESV